MTLPEIAQLMLSFEVTQPKEGDFLLRVTRNEREFFQPGDVPRESYRVRLPRPFQDTALMDQGGWRQRPRPSQPAQNLGLRMWNEVPPQIAGEIHSGSPHQPKRVAIISKSSGIDDVPWEWLNSGDDPANFVAASDAIRFIRLVPCRYALPPITVRLPLRVLTVCTNPQDERLLNPWRERALLVGSIENNPSYELRDLSEPGVDAFKRALEWGPHIVHYVGHAGVTGQSGAIILHDDQNGTRWVTASELSQMLPSTVRLLCLSTCVTAQNYQIAGLSKIAHSPTDLSLPTTIVNQYAIEEEAAHIFWTEFYRALVTDETNLVDAFHGARKLVCAARKDTWSWASFSLIVRDGSGSPMRIARADVSQQRSEAEIHAQWSARLANTLATQVSTLKPEIQKSFAETIGTEEARIEFLRSEIDKY